MERDIRPILTTSDWGKEWVRLQAAREHADDPAVWDARAASFHTKHGPHSGYSDRFIELLGLQPGESVLDMGCGTGALALPLAENGHRVIAADFSQGMLEVLEGYMHEDDIDGIDLLQMSWDDDWAAHGLSENCVDIAIASRSIATNDLAGALAKLTSVARRRACITLPRTSSPRADDSLLRACELDNIVGNDFVYAFNILVSMGRYPEVAYIETDRYETFESVDEAVGKLSAIACSASRGYADEDRIESIEEKIRPWVLEHLVPTDNGLLALDPPRKVVWAFIAWETE